MMVVQVWYWSTNQVTVQRALGAASLATGQKGVLFAALLKVVGFSFLCLPGVLAICLVDRGLLEVGKADEAYPALVQHVLPTWAFGLFGAAVLGSVLSSYNS